MAENRNSQSKKPVGPILTEVRHLREKARYYEQLGCVEIARSLRDLANAKEEAEKLRQQKRA
ncbi:MAG: hypothetical protein MI741_13180 [Rhodospirillales bacterium]|nr:hypothetical protein [Rhodospirillales bacterium]